MNNRLKVGNIVSFKDPEDQENYAEGHPPPYKIVKFDKRDVFNTFLPGEYQSDDMLEDIVFVEDGNGEIFLKDFWDDGIFIVEE